MATEAVNFLRDFNRYIFTGLTNEGLLLNRPYKWAISIHDSSNNPIGAELDDSWYSNPAKRKSIAGVLDWEAYDSDYSQGITNNTLISFEYVPSGQSWVIQYYIIWGIINNNGVDNFLPIYVGEFDPIINLASLEILQFPINTFRIIP